MNTLINSFLIFAAIFHASYGSDSYIIGGNISSPGEAPYQVSLRLADSSHVCGGSIIDTKWILTAAHCIHNVNPVYVIAGSNKINGNGTRYDIAISIKHMWYNSQNFDNDIALIKTVTAIVYTTLIQPIYLPWRNVYDGEFLTLTGWGYTSPTGPISNDLKTARVKVISNLECRTRMGSYVFFSDVCTFTGYGACFGDSGGPLVEGGYVHALVSYGSANCSSTLPQVNVRVFHYNIWIVLTQWFNFWR